jgi:hypothetical protein
MIGMVVALLGASVLVAPVSASLIQIDFAGVVVSVGGDLAGGPINVNDAVAGTFVYDTDIADSHVDATFGLYHDAVPFFSVAAGSYAATTTGSTRLTVSNDRPSLPSPIDGVIVNAMGSVVGAPINGFFPERLQWAVLSNDLSRTLSDAIPDISGMQKFLASDGNWNNNFLTFWAASDRGPLNRQVRWDLTSFSVVSVVSVPDGDGIDNDGDGSGTSGDNPCTGGNTSNCDDNCPDTFNPDQADSDSDGIGDMCEMVAVPLLTTPTMLALVTALAALGLRRLRG